MKASLICHSAKLLEELRQHAQAGGLEVAQALHRKAGEPLRNLLAQAHGDLLVVDSTADTIEADIGALEELGREHPGLPVLMLSPRLEAAVLMAAMRAGVREVLPVHPDPLELSTALRRATERAPGTAAPLGRVIAFVACKGGSGATFLATNLAYALATLHKKRTALLDLDLQYGDAAYFVSDGRAPSSLADLARQVDRLDASLLEASMIAVTPEFHLLPSPEEPESALGVTGFQLERVLQVARATHDFVVLDVERMLDPLAIKGLDQAEVIYLVTENMVPHMRDAKRLVRILRALGYGDQKLRLVVNRLERRGGIDLPQLEKVIGLKVAHTLRDSFEEVAESVNTGVPLVQLHPGNPVAREVREIAESFAPKAPSPKGWLARLIQEAS